MRAIEPLVMTDMYAPIIPCEKTIAIRCISNDAPAHLFAFWNRFIRDTPAKHATTRCQSVANILILFADRRIAIRVARR